MELKIPIRKRYEKSRIPKDAIDSMFFSLKYMEFINTENKTKVKAFMMYVEIIFL